MNTTTFASRLIAWQHTHGRHNLPWQVSDPYRVWLSEIMLQQTQVATVLNYYPRFIARFPNVQSLAAAPQDEVFSLWQGLGYYSRARNLHKAAQQIMSQFAGQFPRTQQELTQLCGVGRSTAAAIAAFAFQQRTSILDGNVKRILCRIYLRDGNPSDKQFEQSLWALAESLMPSENTDMPAYTQGLMDLGATICKRHNPLCHECPMADICQAKAQNKIAELPRKKTPTAIKTMPLYWLLLHDENGALLLQKRPNKGIWGGLYCVPCFEHLADLHHFATQFGINPCHLTENESISHRLTHRLLLITPFTETTIRPSETPNTHSDGIWLSPQQWPNYGLPKPLSTYLKRTQHSF